MLILAAHGSSDPGAALMVEAIAARVAALTPTPVAVAYLDHGPPSLADLTPGADDIVVPLLLASGFHVRTDIPAQAPAARVAAAIGPDQRLAGAGLDRLREAGWAPDRRPLLLAAAGSSDPAALDDVRTAARQLSALADLEVHVAFASAGEPRLADTLRAGSLYGGVVTWLLAPGRFARAMSEAAQRAGLPAGEPLGDHPAVAAVVLARWHAAGDGAAAPGP